VYHQIPDSCLWCIVGNQLSVETEVTVHNYQHITNSRLISGVRKYVCRRTPTVE